MSLWIKDHFLPLMRSKTKSILVIRHGHREEHRSGSFGNELTLTEEGKQTSFAFGKYLENIPLGEIHTSPILRCVQTAEELLKGAHQELSLSSSTVLGDPGPFILDPERAGPVFTQRPLLEIAQAIAAGKTLPGIRSLEEGASLFLQHLVQETLSLSHDFA
jgi:hypothetical protein